MKSFVKYFVPVAVAALALSACNKESEVEIPVGETLEITVEAKADALLGSDDTKTYINSSNTILWGENESMKIGVLGDGEAAKYTFATSTTSSYNGQGSATFTFSVTPGEGKTGSTYTYVGLYPSSAAVSSSNTDVTNYKVKLNEVQNATEGTYDPASYILIAQHVDNKTIENASWQAWYRRATALNKLTLKGLDEDIVSVKITVPDGTAFAGSRHFNLLEDEFGAVYTAISTIEIDYSTALSGTDVSGVNQKEVWFNSWGVELSEGDQMTIVAKSATKSYTRTITARSEGIFFKEGYLNTLGVNMGNITGEDLAFDGCYAELNYADVSSDLTNSYGLVETTKTHGDAWKMNATNASGSIGLKKDDATSYIKLPDFENNIEHVVITLASVTANDVITFDSSASATDGSIASATMVADQLVYSVDLSSESVKTAYLHAQTHQAKIVKIEVYSGTDTRTALTAPENVTASLNATVSNSIDVSWNAVGNAGSYIVTLIAANSPTVTSTTTETSCTVAGLEYNTEYAIAVKAVPADPYDYASSTDADANTEVTTGAASGPQWVRTPIASIADESLVVIVDITSGRAMSNNNGTSSAPSATQISLTGDQSKLAAEPDASLQWTLKQETGGYSFMSGSDYLYVTDTNNGVRVGTGEPRTVFEAYDNSGVVFLHNLSGSDHRYIGVYNNSDWRCYTTINNNIKNTVTAFFVLQDTRSEAPISWNYCDAEVTEGEAEITNSGIDYAIPTLSNNESLSVSYASSDQTVATITNAGVVTALKAGSTTISATYDEGTTGTYKKTVKEYTLTVTDIRTFTITYSSAEGGSFTVKNNATNAAISSGTAVANGTVIKLEATPDTANNYSFTSWTINTSTVTDNPATYTVDGANVTIEASFTQGSTHYYVKVTSEPADWSGTYLIVYTGGNIAFDGSKTADSGATFEVTISDGKIESTAEIDTKTFTIGSMTNGYYLKSASDKYLSGTSGSNKTNYGDSESLNTISFSNGDVLITSNTSVLRYNSGSTLFRYYKSSGYSSQKAIQLYKYN